jgi:4a-hydroxytetrahydrobiopterin dehydratase
VQAESIPTRARARLVQAFSALPSVDAHPPDIDMRPGGVTVRLITYTDDYYGVTFSLNN